MKSRKHLLQPILDSYRESGGINHVDRSNLPSKKTVFSLCDDLLHLLFPGFFSDEAVSSQELPEAAQEIIDLIATEFEAAIAVSLRIRDEGKTEEQYREEAIAITDRLFAGIPGVRALLKTDVEAAYAGDPVAHLLYKEEVPLLPRMMTEWAHSRTGIDIHPGAEIGSHFFIDHGTGVVIGETCVIGNRVKLYHGVTLGARSFQKDDQGAIIKGLRRHPHVEDDVTIYPNGIILGGDTTIGARSTIGANVFLMKSIPPDTLLVRGEQIQSSLDKKSGKKKETVTVQISQDEIDFII
jgi:serine O-acetyltransferase